MLKDLKIEKAFSVSRSFFFITRNKLDPMLSCVFSVTDHRREDVKMW